MDQLRVFISSTSVDLQEQRQAARDAIYGLDQRADDMIYWSADDRTGTTYSVDRVRESDVLILIVAHRYGSIPAGKRYSVTELEYRAAQAAGIPVLAFFLDESVPWPPGMVDWEARNQLQRFKQLVESQVSRKLFRTSEELAKQVTQALAVMLSRQPAKSHRPQSYRGPLRLVTTPVRLSTDPNLLIQIGSSADGLPLLLDIYRGKDLSTHFTQLAEAVASPQHPAPDAMLSTFRQSLEQFATEAWASERMHQVAMRSGQSKTLYVSSFTLVEPFSSVLAGLLGTGREQRLGGGAPDKPPPIRDAASPPSVDPDRFWEEDRVTMRPEEPPAPPRRSPPASEEPDNAPSSMIESEFPEAGSSPALQSVGGRNRFLGISTDDGGVHSVGLSGDSHLEWRPFYYENVLGLLPDAELKFEKAEAESQALQLQVSVPIRDLPQLPPERIWGRRRGADSHIEINSWVEVPRHDVILAIASIAEALGAMHASDTVHGDVKPHNVLVTEQGIVLIDSFDVPVGGIAPGWTPSWSAPEQVLGLPMTAAADVYPLGLMVARALGGQLVGEIRRYRTPRVVGDRSDFDVVHNPSLFIDPAGSKMSRADVGAWRRFVEKALRFDAAQRTATTDEFKAELLRTLERHPVSGSLTFVPPGKLVVARLADGETTLARMISDPLDAEVRTTDRVESESFVPSLWTHAPPTPTPAPAPHPPSAPPPPPAPRPPSAPPPPPVPRPPSAPSSSPPPTLPPPSALSSAPTTPPSRLLASTLVPDEGGVFPAARGRPVESLLCGDGHVNSLDMSYCAICGLRLVPRADQADQADQADRADQADQAGSGKQPAVGELVSDDGRTVVLDRDLVIGRKPVRDDDVQAGRAHPVKVDDMQVSRVHAVVNLRGRDATITDRGSANGTYLTSPDTTTWTKLTAHQPAPLLPGARVKVGRRVFVYRSSSSLSSSSPSLSSSS